MLPWFCILYQDKKMHFHFLQLSLSPTGHTFLPSQLLIGCVILMSSANTIPAYTQVYNIEFILRDKALSFQSFSL